MPVITPIVIGLMASQAWLFLSQQKVRCTKDDALMAARAVMDNHMTDTITDELHFNMVMETIERLLT